MLVSSIREELRRLNERLSAIEYNVRSIRYKTAFEKNKRVKVVKKQKPSNLQIQNILTEQEYKKYEEDYFKMLEIKKLTSVNEVL